MSHPMGVVVHEDERQAQVVTLGELVTRFRRGDRVYVDAAADDAPLKAVGQTGVVEEIEDGFVYLSIPGYASDVVMRVPVTAVRLDRRRRPRPEVTDC